MIPVGESMETGLVLEGVARDLRTDAGGHGSVLREAGVRASLGANRILQVLDTRPQGLDVSPLLGRAVAAGFRAIVDEVAEADRAAQTPLYLLLDDLPVASLIAGYADLYQHKPGQLESSARRRGRALKADICAGWASDATMMQAIARSGSFPAPIGPPAPAIERDADPLGWHRIPPLGLGAMRRRRRIDLIPGEVLRVDAMFRDTHVGPDGDETVVHEYSLEARVEPDNLVILECSAEPRVLPWTECPAAATSAERLAGRRVQELRDFVRQQLTGTSTCTHLNDLLRSLADVAPLARQLAASEAQARPE